MLPSNPAAATDFRVSGSADTEPRAKNGASICSD